MATNARDLPHLLVLHALVTLAAAVVLVVAPAAILRTVGIVLPPDAHALRGVSRSFVAVAAAFVRYGPRATPASAPPA